MSFLLALFLSSWSFAQLEPPIDAMSIIDAYEDTISGDVIVQFQGATRTYTMDNRRSFVQIIGISPYFRIPADEPGFFYQLPENYDLKKHSMRLVPLSPQGLNFYQEVLSSGKGLIFPLESARALFPPSPLEDCRGLFRLASKPLNFPSYQKPVSPAFGRPLPPAPMPVWDPTKMQFERRIPEGVDP